MEKTNKHWAQQDIDYLKDNYHQVDIKELTVRLQRNEASIRWQAGQLGLTEKKNYWSKEDLAFIAENLTTLTYKEIADKLGRSVSAIAHKIADLNIVRNFKSAKLDAIENNVSFFKGKSGEYKALLAAMEIGQSFVYPAEERQTITNQIKYFPDRVFRTRQEDNKSRRVWRLL